MKRALMMLIASLIGLAVAWQFGYPQIGYTQKVEEPPLQDRGLDEVEVFMRAKLVHGQKVLEGLTVEDLDLVAKHSQQLSLLSQAAAWQVLQTPEYHQQSLEFRRSADAMTRAARDKNLDGAALAYLDVTMKCVTCHKYVRRVRMAQRNDIELPEVQAALQQPRQ